MARGKNTDDWLHGELKDINGKLGTLSETAVKQQSILETHIKRTEQNEKMIEKMDERFHPLEKHLSMWAGAGKVIAILGTILGMAAAVYKMLEFYFH